MSSAAENVEDIPCVEECQKRCETFAEITGTDTACAQFYLQDRKWDLERSVNDFYEDRANKGAFRVINDEDGPSAEVVIVFDGSAESLAATATAVVAETALTKRSEASIGDSMDSNTSVNEPCKELKFVTWNIDGLSESNIKLRTKAVYQVIVQTDADVVFLQEVIPQSAEYFLRKLTNYECVFGNTMGYFVGTLLKKSTVKMEKFNIFEFPDSQMNRNVIIISANVDDSSFCFMNAHLESTVESADERKHQLQTVFQKVLSVPDDKTVIFAGDLNLRDKELEELGGIPSGVEDVWATCGSRKECTYTWDQTRNDNLQSFAHSRSKPRCRFDRVYFRGSSPARFTPNYFGLIGLERLLPHRCFPSDHWGILCHFVTKQ